MNLFARTILGYHGCTKEFADRLLGGKLSVKKWRMSRNRHDWLGEGIYFWEHSPGRALRWAEEHAKRGQRPAVVGAVIQLGDCFDLTNEANTKNLKIAHAQVREAYAAARRELPTNRGTDRDLKRRDLDCVVINYYLQQVAALEYGTVRAAFAEGQPAYDGAMLSEESHIQVAVRDRRCIVGVFRPT
jgi:hypothetical protein